MTKNSGALLDGGLPAPLPLPPAPSSPAMARRYLHDALLGHVAPGLLEDIELMVSELVANAVESARTRCVVSLTLPAPGVLRVAIHDFDRTPPVLTHAAAHDDGGRGLYLVDALASAWGTELDGSDGKLVWFEVRL